MPGIQQRGFLRIARLHPCCIRNPLCCPLVTDGGGGHSGEGAAAACCLELRAQRARSARARRAQRASAARVARERGARSARARRAKRASAASEASERGERSEHHGRWRRRCSDGILWGGMGGGERWGKGLTCFACLGAREEDFFLFIFI